MEKENTKVSIAETEEIDAPTISDESDERKKIVKEVKEKHKNTQLFIISLPYGRLFVIRPQDIADIKEATQKVEAFVEEKVAEAGGREAIEKLSETERISILQKIDSEAADITNEICLSRCVVYPYDFAEKMETGVGVPAGAIPVLLEKIYEVSGWQDVEVEEI